MTSPLPEVSELADQLRAAGCVYAEEEAVLLRAEACTPDHLDELLRDRLAGVPLEHVLGWVEFAGRRISLAPGVFVPRRRTELLLRQALAILHRGEASSEGAVVVELCCGAGAVSAALLADNPALDLHASDVDAVAVACAERNLASWNATVSKGDLYEPLPAKLRDHVDLLIASPPYVPTADIAFLPMEARLHEPAMALDGGPDGLAVARRIVSGASTWLAPAGRLLVEAGPRQAAALVSAFDAAGFAATVFSDASVDGMAVVGQRRTPSSRRPGLGG